MAAFKEHSLVRVVKLSKPKKNFEWGEKPREPRMGDEGFIVSVYGTPESPTGYSVEGFENGKEIWLADFSPDELEAIKK